MRKVTFLTMVVLMTLRPLRSSKDTSKSREAILYSCINNCAMCVSHWEEGLYNGPRCAKQCLKHKGQRIVDPDCSKLKMFNYDPEVIKNHRKYVKERALDNDNEDTDA